MINLKKLDLYIFKLFLELKVIIAIAKPKILIKRKL